MGFGADPMGLYCVFHELFFLAKDLKPVICTTQNC